MEATGPILKSSSSITLVFFCFFTLFLLEICRCRSVYWAFSSLSPSILLFLPRRSLWCSHFAPFCWCCVGRLAVAQFSTDMHCFSSSFPLLFFFVVPAWIHASANLCRERERQAAFGPGRPANPSHSSTLIKTLKRKICIYERPRSKNVLRRISGEPC